MKLLPVGRRRRAADLKLQGKMRNSVGKAGITLLLLSCAASAARGDAQARTTTSPHGNLKMPCENCHTFTSWKLLRNVPEFDHNKTRFRLRGLHQGVTCKQCHASLVFTNVGANCAACHADIHQRQFGADCERCHTVRGWQINLQKVRGHENRLPLVGAHSALICDDCHKGAAVGQFQGLSTQCVACHTPQFAQAKSPDHQALSFPTTCDVCHNMDSWMGASFDHGKFTGFPLLGAHAKLDCSACHPGGRFAGTPADCASCHLTDYQKTNDPNHASVGFPTTCAMCHTTVSWQGAIFDHSTTGFPLTGAHAKLDCSTCHGHANYTIKSAACATCHLTDYQKTTDPNHVAVGFPTDCSICHSTASWQGATFDHSKTGFPLTGAHAQLQCQSCHAGGKFTALSTTCVSCHLRNFNSTTSPNHVQAGFPQQCEVCHTTTAWTPATFNHNLTPFPLTGAHTSVPCARCHIGGVFAGTPTDCYSCHKTEYLGTTDPNHVAAGFPTTCQTCHTTTAWTGATFNHTWFPIPHHTARLCSDCHTNRSNYAVFLCTNCHTQVATGQQHTDVKGYVWNSANCYQCHPTGRAG